MVKILNYIAWIFYKYKLFCRFIYKQIFKIIRAIVLYTRGKDIEAILRTSSWQTTRSILFFFTDINVEEKPEKDFPVKRFKIKWYLWVIHYIWGFWVLSKLLVYFFIYSLYEYLKFGLWRDLWLILLEYWRWRLNFFNWGLYIAWHILWLWYLFFNFMMNSNNNVFWLNAKIIKIFNLESFLIKIACLRGRFKFTDKVFWVWVK